MDFIRKLDLFPKTMDDFRVKTAAGGALSLVSIALMLLLFIAELKNYYTPTVTDHLHVNSTRKQSIRVNFDISFPVIPCNLLSLDITDETGVPQKNIRQNVYKHKLSVDGKQIPGQRFENVIGQTMKSEKDVHELHKSIGLEVPAETEGADGSSCGNCYGAEPEGVCCNTCDSVKTAYERVGWLFAPARISQCQREIVLESMKDALAEDGGCQIYGTIELNRASGGFHIAPHKDIHTSGVNSGFVSLIDLISFTFANFNITHKVNSLSFGDNFPGISNPLDGEERTVMDTHGMYQYFIKIVPTTYVSSNCITSLHEKGSKARPSARRCVREIESNQYSVTEHLRHLSPNAGRGLPGLYFNYEVSPIQANFEEKRKTLASLVTSLCAIIGGVYTVMGILDSAFGIASKLFSSSLLS